MRKQRVVVKIAEWKKDKPPRVATPDLNTQIDDILFASIVAVGVREEGTVRDLDTLIIDRQKATAQLQQLVQAEVRRELQHIHHHGGVGSIAGRMVWERLKALDTKEEK